MKTRRERNKKTRICADQLREVRGKIERAMAKQEDGQCRTLPKHSPPPWAWSNLQTANWDVEVDPFLGFLGETTV